MVIPPPLPDADPDPDIRSHHQQQDGHTFESHDTHPLAATVPTVTAEDEKTRIAQQQAQQQQQHVRAEGTQSPDYIRHPRPSIVTASENSDDEVPTVEHFTAWRSFKNMVRSVPILVVVPVLLPVAWALHFSNQNPVAVFVVSLLGIVPLAGGLGFATEEIAHRIGDAWGGLLNATFGNAVELLVAILALVKGDLDIVQASMIGSILSNILLVLGMSYFCGGLRFHEQLYGVVGAQTHISLLGISMVAIMLPEAYHLAFPDTAGGHAWTSRASSADLSPEELKTILALSRGLSFILLAVYVAYLCFQLWTHAYLFKIIREPAREELPLPNSHRVFPRPQWVPSLRTVVSRDTDGGRSTPSPPPVFRAPTTDIDGSVERAMAVCSHSHHDLAVASALNSPGGEHDIRWRDFARGKGTPNGVDVTVASTTDIERQVRRHQVSPHKQRVGFKFAFCALVAFTGLAGLTAECLVSSIDGLSEHTNVSREWIGLIILPVVGNSVEHLTAVTVSIKDKLDLSVAIAVGSSIQVSLCLLPLLTLIGWAIGQPMSLLFDTFETISLVLAVVLVNFAISDGRTNYLEGFVLMMAYVCIALVCWFYDPIH